MKKYYILLFFHCLLMIASFGQSAQVTEKKDASEKPEAREKREVREKAEARERAEAPATWNSPDKIYGELFRDVQLSRVFPDGKTFVDCIPKRKPALILSDYFAHKKQQGFVLKKFVEENFELPAGPAEVYLTNKSEDIVTHVKNLWKVLKRAPDTSVSADPADSLSSLLPLPYPYIVPGGRFREIYYWDSYFTMLGLKESGEYAMMENMVKNFAYLIETYGHVPNGNRTYYLSRSQPPFFSVMVALLAEVKGDSIYQIYLPAMEKEYNFWMEGSEKLKTGQAYRRVVKMNDGSVMNRYWDDEAIPRQESYREDLMTAARSGRNKEEMYRNLRAGAESGIDFSSRWFADPKSILTIRTTDMVTVDLNSLLYHLETAIAKAKLINKDEGGSLEYRGKAKIRGESINKFCWNTKLSFYSDYNFKAGTQSDRITPAGLYPFCFINEHLDYLSFLGMKVAGVLRQKLLKPGGIASSEFVTGQQWDAPNGWSPQQWMTIWALDRCGQKDLAADIAGRWVKLVVKVYKETGKLMEKYNVSDPDKEAGGGEYPGQDGFGWTNGVLLKLISQYNLPVD